MRKTQDESFAFFTVFCSISAQSFRFLPLGRSQFCWLPKIEGLNSCDVFLSSGIWVALLNPGHDWITFDV